MNFANKFKALRIEARLTQKEVAERLHVSLATARHIKKGLSIPSSKAEVTSICAALGWEGAAGALTIAAYDDGLAKYKQAYWKAA